MKKLTLISPFLFCLILSATIFAQQRAPAVEQGIELNKKGEYDKAVSVLSVAVKANKNDGEAIYYLGAAEMNAGNLKAARKSFQKAVKLLPNDARPLKGLAYIGLRNGKFGEAQKYVLQALALNPNDVETQYLSGVINFQKGNRRQAIADADKAIALEPNFAPAYLLKSEAVVRNFDSLEEWTNLKNSKRAEIFKQAASILEQYPNLAQQSPQTAELRETREAYGYFADYFAKKADDPVLDPQAPPVPPAPGEEKMEVLTQPKPGYTEEARKNGIQGTIRLLVLFHKDGTVKYVMPLNGLRYGLTEKSIEAAKRIRFVPAKKDGAPISQVKLVEYRFAIY